MNAIPLFLAQVDPQDPLAWWRLSNPVFRERLIIFGAIALLTLLLLCWAAFLRNNHHRRHSHHRHHRHQHAPTPAEIQEAPRSEDGAAPPEKRRRWRRSHHRHHPRNPTLAETGGLPPIRPEDPPEAKP